MIKRKISSFDNSLLLNNKKGPFYEKNHAPSGQIIPRNAQNKQLPVSRFAMDRADLHINNRDFPVFLSGIKAAFLVGYKGSFLQNT
jgi:hypothetical protein